MTPEMVVENHFLREYDHSDNPFQWKLGRASPHRCVEAHGVVVDGKLFLFGGYEAMDRVLCTCQVFDLSSKKWVDEFCTPPAVPQTHKAVATDGEFIFLLGGQLGPHCAPCTDQCFALRVATRTWQRLVALPAKRYLSAGQYWRGRLHVIGGSREDRFTAARDHWSLPVNNGQAAAEHWQEEIPIPRGGIHCGSVVLDDCLYVVGGTEGDVQPIAGDPDFRCDFSSRRERAHGELWMLEPEASQWKRLPDLPARLAHTDTTVVVMGKKIFVFGGTCDVTDCTRTVYAFDTNSQTWDAVGFLPYPMKCCVAAEHDGIVYLFAGQRSRGKHDLRPGRILNTVWMADIKNKGFL